MLRGFVQGILSSIAVWMLGAFFASYANAGPIYSGLSGNDFYTQPSRTHNQHMDNFMVNSAPWFLGHGAHGIHRKYGLDFDWDGLNKKSHYKYGWMYLFAWTKSINSDWSGRSKGFATVFSIWGLILSNDDQSGFAGERKYGAGSFVDPLSPEAHETDTRKITAVPEPSAMAFVVIGLLSLGVIRSRRF